MYEYPRPTDAVHRIELESAIDKAVWDRGVASIGEEVEFQVYTRFVSDGSEAKIKVCNSNGRKLDELNVNIYGNRCKGRYTITDRARDNIYYEVELRSHGLSGRSDDLRIIPQRSITNPRWSQQEARRGDIVTLSADVTNFPEGVGARFVIYEYDAEGAHDLITEIKSWVENSRVETKWAYEYHEDTDEIPTHQETERGYNPPEYLFKVVIGSKEAQSDLLLFKDWIEFTLTDQTGAPAPNQDYILHLPDNQQKRGRSDDQGVVRERDVPPGPWWIEVVNNADG
jgi:hypothetical protein